MRSTGATRKCSLRGVLYLGGISIGHQQFLLIHAPLSVKFLNHTAAKRTFQISSVLPTINSFLFSNRDSRYTAEVIWIHSSFLDWPTFSWYLLDISCSTLALALRLFISSGIQGLIVGASAPISYLFGWRLRFLTLTSLIS